MRKKVLVIFTDGETTVGPDPAPIAAALRDDDVEIYCIGLVGRPGLNAETLRSWASEPVDEHVITTPNEEELERAFHDLADTCLLYTSYIGSPAPKQLCRTPFAGAPRRS